MVLLGSFDFLIMSNRKITQYINTVMLMVYIIYIFRCYLVIIFSKLSCL